MKKFLIHLLGGITPEESAQSNDHCLTIGQISAYKNIKALADSMYGKDWTNTVYNHILGCLTRLESPTTVPDDSPSGNTEESHE